MGVVEESPTPELRGVVTCISRVSVLFASVCDMFPQTFNRYKSSTNRYKIALNFINRTTWMCSKYLQLNVHWDLLLKARNRRRKSRLCSVSIIEQKSCTLACECAGYPRVEVCDSPSCLAPESITELPRQIYDHLQSLHISQWPHKLPRPVCTA